MRVNASGNISIGNTNDTYTLDIDTNEIRLQGIDSNTGPNIVL